MNDAHIVRRLWVVLCIYETLVIVIVAGAGLNISLSGGGSLYMAAPLLLIACAEALRIPLSAVATRLRWFGKLLAAIALLAIAIGSAEGLAVAFEAFLQNRVVEIMRAAHKVEWAQQAVDKTANDRALNDAAVASLANEVRNWMRRLLRWLTTCRRRPPDRRTPARGKASGYPARPTLPPSLPIARQ
jgi:hypothetical protein